MEEEDQFFWLMECAPTASQEAEFPNCPYARESEGLVVRSPSPSPSSPTSPVGSPIRITSLPGTPTSPDRRAADEDDSRLLEGPNPKEVGAQEGKRGRAVAGEEVSGEIEVVETEGGEGVVGRLAAKAARSREIECSMKSGVVELDAISSVEGTGGVEKPSDSSGSSDCCVIVGSKSREEAELEVVQITKSGKKIAKGGHGNGGEGSSTGKRIPKISGKRRKLTPLQKGKEKGAVQSLEEMKRLMIKERAKAVLHKSEGRRRSTRFMKEKAKDEGESSKKSCEGPDPKLVALVEELLKQEDVDSFRTAKEKGFKFNNLRYLSTND